MSKIDYDKLLKNISIDDVAKRLGMELKHTALNQNKAICPFHDDKTPSLLIDSSRANGRQHYYCFACGAHGDVIDLVKQRLNLGFKEAVDWLSPGVTTHVRRNRLSGIESSTSSTPPSASGLELGYKIYKDRNNQSELDIWINKRCLDRTALVSAGYVHAIRNALSRQLNAETDVSVRREQAGYLEDAHLVRKPVPGVSPELHLPLIANDSAINLYSDFFIGDRIIFPLHNERKELLGLAGRSVSEVLGSATPKYQFTRGFPKTTVLYRADHAFEFVRSKWKNGFKDISIYLCEGFLDALRFESIGLPAVAVMGNVLSEHQEGLLRKLSDDRPKDVALTVVICFDRDEAGLRGAEAACLKLMRASQELAPVGCKFLWPTTQQLQNAGCSLSHNKDPNEYLQDISAEEAINLISKATHPPHLAVLANAFGVSADEILDQSKWEVATRTRRIRAFNRAFAQIKKVLGSSAESELKNAALKNTSVLTEWLAFIEESSSDSQGLLSDIFLNDSKARLNHSRILAYMGSRRGELPCDEPRWERLDIAATAFNTLLVDRLISKRSQDKCPIGSYDAVWVPRSFGGAEYRLKMMPRPEDLIIQQYLLNEILTERWDHQTYTGSSFSRMVPAVRYYREDRRTVTTGFDSKGDEHWGELNRTLSFAYQIDMDVLEGRQPATDQGMYRPFHECWRDFMKSITKQAADIGYVYSIRLDVKRYYDRLRRYIVRDRLLAKLQAALETVPDFTPGFAELIGFEDSKPDGAAKAAVVLDRLDEHLFGVRYARPDTGLDEEADPLIGIPQGPVLSAWIGSIALFPIDEEANRFIERFNTDRNRVGYARYVDDIVLLADDPELLEDMRDAIDSCARRLELTLLAKAEEIPPMSADDFAIYLNQGRALAASGPAWEPPLIGDGESGWEFWTVTSTTDRQSALHLLHNVELYKASKSILLQTVRTAFQAPDLRASELSKAARLIWYSIAVECSDVVNSSDAVPIWARYLEAWNGCMKGIVWCLQPDKNQWEAPILFALEGLEHLFDKNARDIGELSAEENSVRRKRIVWLAENILTPAFDKSAFTTTHVPEYQLEARLNLVRWKAEKLAGKEFSSSVRLYAERSKLIQTWHPFEWMHEAVALLGNTDQSEKDPLDPFVNPTKNKIRMNSMSGLPAEVFMALLPDEEPVHSAHLIVDSASNATANRVALQTIVSIVPKDQLAKCLSRRHRLIWRTPSANMSNRLTLPALPGITTSRLFSCLGDSMEDRSFVNARGIEVIDFSSIDDKFNFPVFFGSDGVNSPTPLAIDWQSSPIDDANESFVKLSTELNAKDYLCLRERIQAPNHDLTANVLKNAARLFRSISQVVIEYSKGNDDKDIVAAWPYIAKNANKEIYYLICDGVSRAELGNRAFVRDGGRALRTIEVPIYEASLWRVGVAVSDYMGLHDDIIKFSGSDDDINLNAAALANPARYVLRTQLRKLRGAYADSKIGKRHESGGLLPATVERSLHLLETYPEKPANSLETIFHILAAEAESAGMFLAFRERWESSDATSFLNSLVSRVLSRIPLALGQILAISDANYIGLRRDVVGLICFAKRIFDIDANSAVAQLPAWKALCAGTVSIGISVAIDGILASMRSHGAFERYQNFDFPAEWEIPISTILGDDPEIILETGSRSRKRVSLIDKLRRLVQHLGHRMYRVGDGLDRLPNAVYENLRDISQKLATIEYPGDDGKISLEWPFDFLNSYSLELLNFELLESVVEFIEMIDDEFGFELVLVKEKSYGFSPQTRRFTDSRNGVRDVTPWMISQFPRGAKHIEEISANGSILRVWSEVFDRKSGTLLSVSALGEPFASIAVIKPALHGETTAVFIEHQVEIAPSEVDDRPPIVNSNFIDNEIISLDAASPGLEITSSIDGLSSPMVIMPDMSSPDVTGGSSSTPSGFPKKSFQQSEEDTHLSAHDFLRRQVDEWSKRGDDKDCGHIRVALLQANFDLTYKHPLIETSPSGWPFCSKVKEGIFNNLKTHPELKSIYGPLLNAVETSNAEYLWLGSTGGTVNLPSWSEYRRRNILKRVIDSCEAFKVDLLVLPEYSVRRETIDWLKTYLAKKSVSVLAGTYMNFQRESGGNYLAAPLTLLWPLPNNVSNAYIGALKGGQGDEKYLDAFHRGHVVEFSRDKKYRSIALEEFFRPSSKTLKPLFLPEQLVNELKRGTGFPPSAEVVSELLANTSLPLKHIFELICSEIFLVSSPANYSHMMSDLKSMSRRFGGGSRETGEIFADLGSLASNLSITGNGRTARRSILAVPAATSRSADYWIAGQASFLAAGIATVFCNSVDGGSLVGGSCFIGCGSWKSEESAKGYISRITPYHGWSKGIFYNNKNDALSKYDQAVVIADIDPHNMLEGKPRAQTMPSPLQLVAYLPLAESVDWSRTEANLLKTLSMPVASKLESGEAAKARPQDEGKFWAAVGKVKGIIDERCLTDLWRKFPDANSLALRANAFLNNGGMQPAAPIGAMGLMAAPALYDWINVSLTLNEQQELPTIAVPSWKTPKI